MFFKKATKFDEIFTIGLTLCSKCQIDGEDFVNKFVAFLENMNFNRRNSWNTVCHYGNLQIYFFKLQAAKCNK